MIKGLITRKKNERLSSDHLVFDGDLNSADTSDKDEMKQPKFKFGDRVKDKSHGQIFEVEAVIFHERKRFMYLVKPDSVIMDCHFDGGYWEDDLELYQEPQAKKLYAYIFKTEVGNQIGFFEQENESQFGRRPEYDIEYPTKVVKNSEVS